VTGLSPEDKKEFSGLSETEFLHEEFMSVLNVRLFTLINNENTTLNYSFYDKFSLLVRLVGRDGATPNFPQNT
jgi:hypothetical protein